MVLSEWNTRWKIIHALGNLVPNHLETCKLEWKPALGVLLQQINLTVTSSLLYSNASTIALQKSPWICLVRLLEGFHILPERLWQSALHPDCPRQRKCISSPSGHTIETQPEFQTWADQKALIFCVSRSVEIGLSIIVWVDAFLNTGLSHQNAAFGNLLAKILLYLTIQEIKRDLTALCRRSSAACSILSYAPHHDIWEEGSSFINQCFFSRDCEYVLGLQAGTL